MRYVSQQQLPFYITISRALIMVYINHYDELYKGLSFKQALTAFSNYAIFGRYNSRFNCVVFDIYSNEFFGWYVDGLYEYYRKKLLTNVFIK